MPFDFPASPTVGQQYSPVGGPTYQWNGGAWIAVSNAPTAEARNRIVNPCFQISQEQDNTAGTGNGYFAADQWTCAGIGTAVVSQQRVQVTTPNGSTDRLRYTVATADASLTTNEYFAIRYKLEGTRVADFKWGSAGARQIVLRFGFKGPAGLYVVGIRNLADVRTYLASFTISAGQANTDTQQVLVIPGDTTGVWPVDTGTGFLVDICLGAGPSLQGVAGWQAGSLLGVAGMSNGLASTSNVFELFDVGLYLDPDNTGLPPKWQAPDHAEELRACMRYFYKTSGAVSSLANRYGAASATVADAGTIPFMTSMRSTPAGAATTAPTYTNCSAINMITDLEAAVLRVTVTALGTYRAASGVYTFSARM